MKRQVEISFRLIRWNKADNGREVKNFPICTEIPFGGRGIAALAGPAPKRKTDVVELCVTVPEGFAAIAGENGRIFRDGPIFVLDEFRDGDTCVLEHHSGVTEFTVIHPTERGVELEFYPSRDKELKDLPDSIRQRYAEQIRRLLQEVRIIDESKVVSDVRNRLEALKALEQKLSKGEGR